MMSYERACELLGYETPPAWPDDDARGDLAAYVDEITKGGTEPIRPQDAALFRDQFETFG
jgi:hypothetical protein